MEKKLHHLDFDKDKISSRRLQGKRMLANIEACKVDLKNEIPTLFEVFDSALEKTNMVLKMMPLHSRSRALEASIIQSCFADCLMTQFNDRAFYGKFKRLILRVKGYLVLFKKLDKNGYPMNIKTGNVQSILNQSQQLNLFVNSDYTDDPILYFGYQKNKFGEFVSPQIVYIDEGEIKFSIDRSFLSMAIPLVRVETQVSKEIVPTLKGEKVKKSKLG